MIEEFSERLKSKVLQLGTPISSEDISVYAQLQDINDKSLRLRTILQSWAAQQTEERTLRNRFATRLLWAFFIQVLLMNVLFVLIGFHYLEFDGTVVNVFIISVFTELTSMIFLILKYLFPQIGLEVLNIIKNL